MSGFYDKIMRNIQGSLAVRKSQDFEFFRQKVRISQDLELFFRKSQEKWGFPGTILVWQI